MRFTLGAAAEIKISDPIVLKDPLIHRIPSVALIQRLRLFADIESRGWSRTA